MTTRTFNPTKWTRISLLVLASCCLALTSRAQTPERTDLRPAQHTLLDAALDESYATGIDAEGMSAAEWKAFAADQRHGLKSPDRSTQEEAMRQIIFLATYHSDRVNLRKAAAELYAIYRFDRDERRRIMALAGLHAVGYEETMRYMAQDVQWEKSPRVRRLTRAALVDHYAEQVR